MPVEETKHAVAANGHAMMLPEANKSGEGWLIRGKIFSIAISETRADQNAARKRLDELASAANDIASGDPTARLCGYLQFVLDNDETPSAILGPMRSEDNLDVRVLIYSPGTHPKVGR